MSQNIKFFSDDEVAVKHFPPLPASKVVPQWFKDLPLRTDVEELTAEKYLKEQATIPMSIKGCMPATDYISSGYVIRAAADFAISPKPEQHPADFFWTSAGGKCDAHSHAQCPVSVRGRDRNYIKIMSSWRVVTPPGYSCYFYQPEFMFNEMLKLFPAVVDTDGYNNAVNFPGVITTDQTFTICAGDPLMVVFPFKRQDWDHTVSFAPEPKNAAAHFFARGYKTLFHNQKRYR